MKNQLPKLFTGIPNTSTALSVKRSSVGFFPDPTSHCRVLAASNGSSTFKQNKADSVIGRMIKIGKKADNFALGLREHVRLAPKISETLKGKLSLGARILQKGGVQKVFKQLFSVGEGEKLLKASQCYLYTTAGPLAGLLFISTEKIAFCSERSIKVSSPTGESVRVHYKVLIPLEKIMRVKQSANEERPSQKYIEVVTVDNFDFWFMGFLNYKKAYKYLQQAISHASLEYGYAQKSEAFQGDM